MACARGCCATQREHYLSVGISAAAMPSRSGPVVAKLNSDKLFSKDGDAYKRLRKEGLQPERINGCAALETVADTKFEVENLVMA